MATKRYNGTILLKSYQDVLLLVFQQNIVSDWLRKIKNQAVYHTKY